MEDAGVDAFIALKSVNVEYLSGFDDIRDTSNPHLVLITAHEARLITDARYLEVAETQRGKQMRELGLSEALWQVDDPGDKPILKSLVELWDLSCFDSVALEDSVPYRIFTSLADSLAKAGGADKLVPAKNWVEDLRTHKDAEEIRRIKTAQAITDKSFTNICSYLRPGLSEKEVAAHLEYTLRKNGADGLAFSSIVATGPNASLPHAVPSDRKLAAGDLLILDFGASYAGYCSDMTRTVFIGGSLSCGTQAAPTDEQRLVYDTVLAAQEASLAAFRKGTTGVEVDTAGRKVIDAAGYGERFVHGTGHGLGLEIHELPNASQRSPEELNAGAVMTCEPGIYLPGNLGVRIEDLVVVEEGGSTNLTTSTKELLIV
jgi:Xaa-Pro aminopeptidase